MTCVDGINETAGNYLYNTENIRAASSKDADDESIFTSCGKEATETNIAETDDAKEEEKGFFAKIGDFFLKAGNAIKNFFAGLFGKKEASKESESIEADTEADMEEDADNINTDNSKADDAEKEIDNNIAKDDNCDKEIPEIVMQKYGMFADDIYYNKNGEIVITIKSTGAQSIDVDFGEVCGTFCDDNGDEYYAIVLEGSKKFYNDTKNGEIENTKQSPSTGDCWLLSTVNSLSYTQEGREIIKDSLEYKDDCTIVHFKGANDYTITDDELETARLSGKYSSGDNDMIIFELAMEKAFEDIENGNVHLSSAGYNQASDSITGGTTSMAFEIITDKDSKMYHNDARIDDGIEKTDDEGFKEFYTSIKASTAMEEFEANNNSNIAFTAEIKKEGIREVSDINGKTINLDGKHGYAIKEVNGDKVVITDPHDSGKDIILTKDTAASAFDYYFLCDLSNN